MEDPTISPDPAPTDEPRTSTSGSRLKSPLVMVVVAALGVLITSAWFLWDVLGTPKAVTITDIPVPVSIVDSGGNQGPTVTATVVTRIFQMPLSVLQDWSEACDRTRERVDSALLASGVAPSTLDLGEIFSTSCNSNWPLLGYFMGGPQRMVEVKLQNDGAGTARSVSVKIPSLHSAEWSREGGAKETIPTQSTPRAYLIEIGDLRPGENAQVIAWTGILSGDTVSVFLEHGTVAIQHQ